MNVNLLPFGILWMLLSAAVVALIAYRAWVARNEDDSLHVMEAGLTAQQVLVGHKLDVIDRWGKMLTMVALVSGIALGSVYLFQNWEAASAQLWR
ncbi:MAG TPA: hypothetical protein VL285_17680 [Bryobacteraceae bacterium]|jgi:hypothetical protein|nr:hypothetical protein [Bryobacteraceae bacterium]